MRRNYIIWVCFDKFSSYCNYFNIFQQEYISFRGYINYVQKGKKERNFLKNADEYIHLFHPDESMNSVCTTHLF